MESFQFFVTIFRKDKGIKHSEYYFKAKDIDELREKFVDFLNNYQEKLKAKPIKTLPKLNHITPRPQLKYRVKFTPKKKEK